MFHTYILLSEKTWKFYIGSTGNLEDRFFRHSTGRSKATLSGRPWKLIWTEEFNTRSDAYKREMEIKVWKSHDRIVQLVKRIPSLNGRVVGSNPATPTNENQLFTYNM